MTWRVEGEGSGWWCIKIGEGINKLWWGRGEKRAGVGGRARVYTKVGE